jgi:LAO/AO transport system kinase
VEKGEALGDGAPDTPPIIGFTGPPGAGKSTLIAALIERVRNRGETVAILAVDPSSPVTGGAILGDRIRMQAHVEDPGVYIRSMASRGHLGGLSEATGDAVALMRMAGFDRIFVETVGVGQSEVEVMGLADVVVLVVGPAWGDQVQADKAGVVEVADLFVVNKADRSGAVEVKRALTEAAQARGAGVLLVSALTGEGAAEVLAEVDRLAGL